MKIAFLIIVAILIPEVAFAQSTHELKVLGWLGRDIFVRNEESGNGEDENGDPNSYRANSISVYDNSIRHDEEDTGKPKLVIGKSKKKISYLISSSGSLPEELKRAVADKPELGQLIRPWLGPLSKDRRFAINIVSSKSIERKGKEARCLVTHRIRLFDKENSILRDVLSFNSEGEFQSGRFPDCPDVRYQTVWSVDNKSFALLNPRSGNAIYNFSLTLLEKHSAGKKVLAYQNPVLSSAWLSEDSLWMKLIGGEKISPKSLGARKDSSAKLGELMVRVQNGQIRKALKGVEKTIKKMKKTPQNYALAAAVFREAGKTAKATQLVNKLVAKGNIEEVVQIANFFQFFDLDISAQLYVIALSSKKMKEGNAIQVYEYLLRTLLDSGNMSAAKEVVEKVKDLKANLGIQELRYRVLRREPGVLTEVQHFVEENPTHCEAYLVLGRAFGYKASKDAMNQYRTAMQCDPQLSEAIYLLGDLKKRAGDWTEARLLFDQYRKVAKARKGDIVRDARRQYAYDITHPKKDEESESEKK